METKELLEKFNLADSENIAGNAGSDKELNTEVLHDLLSSGTPKKAIAKDLGMSVGQLNRTISELQESQGLLLQYRELQNLQLTNLQAKILSAITPDKIDNASLTELCQAFRILKDKELVASGKQQVTGLVAYLVAIEKEEINGQLAGQPHVIDCQTLSTEFSEDDATLDDDLDGLPNL